MCSQVRSGPGAPGLDILLAEDTPTLQLVIREVLGKAGHRVTLAGTGAEACVALGAGAFDLVIIDLLMPGMDGDEVVRRLRGGGLARADMPVLVLTAAMDPDLRARVEACGADRLLDKPFRCEELMSAIAALVPCAPGRG